MAEEYGLRRTKARDWNGQLVPMPKQHFLEVSTADAMWLVRSCPFSTTIIFAVVVVELDILIFFVTGHLFCYVYNSHHNSSNTMHCIELLMWNTTNWILFFVLVVSQMEISMIQRQVSRHSLEISISYCSN